MPSTKTIANTINWCASFIEQQPVLINGLEPALTSANLIKQTILGPPFVWPWNRSNANYTTSSQDSIVTGLTDLGFVEGGSVQIDGGKPMALAVKNVMEMDNSAARPQFISPFIDDGQGNITFRLMPAPDPDTSAEVNVIYQRSAAPMLSVASTWAPIPDELMYVPQWGFLSLLSLIGNDARFNNYNQKFVTSLLSAQGGLNDMERNIFLANWTRVISQIQATQLGTNERYRARET